MNNISGRERQRAGETWAGDGSAKKGVMGQGASAFNDMVATLQFEWQERRRVRPELAAIARTLQATSIEVDLLYLCDSEAALNKVSRWIGSTLAGDAKLTTRLRTHSPKCND